MILKKLLNRLEQKLLFCRFLSTSHVRVRFAPSPTGLLHLGGLRTAFYNYLFALKNSGTFVLRIEDTDQDRLVPGAVEALEDNLVWAGIKPHEGPSFGGEFGPYLQSERLELYKKKAFELLESGAAYRCFCSELRLKLLRKEATKNREVPKYDRKCSFLSQPEVDRLLSERTPFTIRLKMKNGPITFKDIVFGDMSIDLSLNETDPIIFKSDGFPTYHLANVVDDHYMQITHVLRGVEWQTSTPKHLMLYEAFGWQPPNYAHMPLIINKDNTKLSKRQNDITIQNCREEGFYKEAILNYLTNLGGGFGKKTEDSIYNLEELAAKFDINKVNKSNCKFELDRMKLYNRLCLNRYIKESVEILISQLKHLIIKNIDETIEINEEKLKEIILWSSERIITLSELFDPEFIYLWKAPNLDWDVNQIGGCQEIVRILNHSQSLVDDIFNVEDKTIENISQAIKSYYEREFSSLITYKNFMKLMRLSLTNQKSGPPIAEIFKLLGPKKTIQYLLLAQNYVKNNSQDQVVNSKH